MGFTIHVGNGDGQPKGPVFASCLSGLLEFVLHLRCVYFLQKVLGLLCGHSCLLRSSQDALGLRDIFISRPSTHPQLSGHLLQHLWLLHAHSGEEAHGIYSSFLQNHTEEILGHTDGNLELLPQERKIFAHVQAFSGNQGWWFISAVIHDPSDQRGTQLQLDVPEVLVPAQDLARRDKRGSLCVTSGEVGWLTQVALGCLLVLSAEQGRLLHTEPLGLKGQNSQFFGTDTGILILVCGSHPEEQGFSTCG